jgi:hypothetical protein
MPTDSSPMADEPGLQLQMMEHADGRIAWGANAEQIAAYVRRGYEPVPIPEPRNPNSILLIRADGAIAWCETADDEQRFRSMGFCLPNELPEPKRAADITDTVIE